MNCRLFLYRNQWMGKDIYFVRGITNDIIDVKFKYINVEYYDL